MAGRARRPWLLAGIILLALPAVFVFLQAFLSRLGWETPARYTFLGLWLGYGFALSSLFGVGLTRREGIHPGAPWWLFGLWGLGAVGALAWAILGSDGPPLQALLPVVQVLFTIAVAAFVFSVRHRGLKWILGSIVVGGLLIAGLAALIGLLFPPP